MPVSRRLLNVCLGRPRGPSTSVRPGTTLGRAPFWIGVAPTINSQNWSSISRAVWHCSGLQFPTRGLGKWCRRKAKSNDRKNQEVNRLVSLDMATSSSNEEMISLDLRKSLSKRNISSPTPSLDAWQERCDDGLRLRWPCNRSPQLKRSCCNPLHPRAPGQPL